jgi:hypothetical protein
MNMDAAEQNKTRHAVMKSVVLIVRHQSEEARLSAI